MAYFSCVQLHPPTPPIHWDFEYTNLSIHQASDSVLTDINWNIADTAPNNMRYKSWVLEFKVSEGATSGYNCIMSRPNTDTGEWFVSASGTLYVYDGDRGNEISTSAINDNSNIRIEFEPDLTDQNAQSGTVSVYKNNVLDKQSTCKVAYGSNANYTIPLRIGAYNPSGSDLFNGTFEYIRFRVLN